MKTAAKRTKLTQAQRDYRFAFEAWIRGGDARVKALPKSVRENASREARRIWADYLKERGE